MINFLLIAAVLSLSSPGDYYYTHPTNIPASLFQGLGIGPDGDYRMLRAEDVAFLHEAYVERGNVPYSYGVLPIVSGAGRADSLTVANLGESLRGMPGWIFDDRSMASCFPLSCDPALNSRYPGAFITDPYGSHVSSSFEFRHTSTLEPVTGSVWQVDGRSGFRYAGANVDWPDGAGLVSTNVFAYWEGGRSADAADGANRMRRIPAFAIVTNLYASLNAFDYAVQEATRVVVTNPLYVSRYYQKNKSPSEYSYTTYTKPNGASGAYASGVNAWATNEIVSLEASATVPISTTIQESRIKIREYERDYYLEGSEGSETEHWVYFDDHISWDESTTFHSVSNNTLALAFMSPVATDSVTQVEIIDTALLVCAVRAVTLYDTIYTLDGQDISTSSNRSGRAMMAVRLGAPTVLSGQYNAGHQLYAVPWPVDYLKRQADLLFGDIGDESPNLGVNPPTDGSRGEYRHMWGVVYTTSFARSDLYIFYRRKFHAKLEQ